MAVRKAAVAALLICLCAIPQLQAAAQDPVDALAGAIGGAVQAIAWGLVDIWMGIRVELAVDAGNPNTRGFVLSRVKPEHEGEYSIAQICDVWDYCVQTWHYFSDPVLDDFAPASDTIAMGLRGDCDDFAALIAAAVRGLGGTAMVRVEHTSTDGHAYTLVYIGTDISDVAGNILYLMARYGVPFSTVRQGGLGLLLDSEAGVWLNLDWSANHPGGPLWAPPAALVDSHFYTTPSVLWVKPILQAPGYWQIGTEFSLQQLQALVKE